MRLFEARDELLNLPLFADTFRKSMGGELHYAHDLNSTWRDRQFELEVLLQFREWGFAAVPHVEGDVEIALPTGRLFVECKRPSKARRLVPRMHEGFEQIEVRRRTNDRGLGIVALDATLVTNRALAHWKAGNRIDADRTASGLADWAAERLRILLQHEVCGRLNVAAACRLRIPVWQPDYGWNDYQWWVLLGNHRPHVRARETFQLLNDAAAATTEPGLSTFR